MVRRERRETPGTALFFPTTFDGWTTGEPILLPEGASDTACLLSGGLCAIGRPGNTGGVELLGKLRLWANHEPVVVGDKDKKRPDPDDPRKCGNCMADERDCLKGGCRQGTPVRPGGALTLAACSRARL